ncbi:transposon Tf2-2 polyprotein [Citrus sinensis]|uniref:Transposon Tf2-2 polyprotein n=1 Tax=Citrus sinensis TaxID=2711 RepID=A0ACB8KCK2_CITSI|nr:transposon Tf2-2 polyprotein [Citrus sinensis]
MASTSSSTPSTHVTLSSTLSLPKSCTSHTANKIENLVEYSYIPESAQITESSYPLLSPYQLYKRPSSFTRSIRTLISTRRPHPKEYIQSSRLDQCSLQAIPAEQYVTLEIPSELISNWKQEGFTHLHLGGIRLILTLHGRKGLPVTARLAMLDTRFKQYQDAVIGTVLTTLHAGSVLLTFYPNFNLSLQDPNLPTTLKVQIQIQGAEQISSAKIATLHYQLVYRLQNHALDLPTPEHHSNTLMLLSESMFERRQDRTVRMTFKPPPSAPQKPPRLSFTYSSMITAVQTAQEDLPITGFNSEGYPVYPAKHNGHFLWDAPGSGMCDPNCPCWDDWEEDDDYATTRKKKPKRKKPPIPCHHCNPKPPSDPPPPPAPLPIYRNELKWIAKHCNSEIPSPLSDPTPIVQPLACMMFSSTSSDYSSSFPPLEPHTDSQRNVVSKPFIPSPITSTGHLEPPKPFESVLNWQTQNARAQNDTLLHLNSKVEHISLRTEQIETKVDSITAQMQYNGPEFDQKEREIRRLKAELAQIESEKQRPTLFTTSPPIPSIGPTYHPFVSILSPIKQYDPSKLFGMTHTLFRDNPLPPPPKPKPRPRPQPRPAPLHPSSLTIPGQPSPTPTPTSPPAPLSVPTQSKDKEPMHQFTAHTVDHSSTTDNQTSDSNLAVSNSPTETDTESSASTSDSEKSYADITKILMAQPDPPTQGQPSHTEPYIDIPSEVKEEMPESSATNQPSPAQPNPPSQKSSNGPWFTFDDLPSHKWRDRLNEMSAWIDLQMLRKRSNNSIKVSSALAVLHDQFLGDPSAVFEAARRDYLNMKCCSLNAKDLDFHYKRMSLLFYKLNGFNEPTLKHVFLASLPEELQPDIQRQLTASNLSLDNISLGKIFQLAKTCLDKLCEQKQFFKELLKDKEPFRNPESPTGSSERNLPPPENSNESNQANVLSAREKATMPKIVPIKDKREKSIRLVEHLQATTDYSPAKDELEFYFSEQDEPNDETLFALQNSSDSDSDQSQVIFHQQLLSLDTTVPIPSIKLQILPSKFQRPIPAIGLIDTGAQRSMLNPHILPSEYWTQSEEHFKAVNGKLFTTSLITKKPIGIQIFPNCVIWTKVIGSTLPNKDILIGFDILHQIRHLQIIPTGILVKSMFKPFTNILKLYHLSETPQSYQDISTKLLSFCLESHSEFTHPNPLWKNKSFFIKLPFKLNEYINPTKATHPGMSPSDLLLAQQECSQLLAQGLIEPTSSQWACQAFYVEKHSEIVRGKKRLVTDYQPLNMFLQDDKFPLPSRQSMFNFLKNAQIFSKFDLKSSFWQLGIEPSERYKTTFCIPNAHFQWTVLPFGLKTAPSIFQKSMVQLFQPILHHALIYIDDILLFSGSHDDHRQLLTQFYDIIQSHGIMLSAKKSTIATDNIEFLGMIIKDGHYQPGKHIAQELLHFPDQQLSKRQIQQFLGIINYIRDFLPHVDHHTHHLSALLKKQPPEWNADHTAAVTTLKQIAQNPPPLKLITDGKRILQTDASDESWGAILLEELNDKEHFIAYASGHFSET